MIFNSTTFLFLFLPASIVLYYLIPAKKSLTARNVVLLLFSLGFYAWGEPVRIAFLCVLTILVWLFGKMAEGKRKTIQGKIAVTLTVIITVSSLFVYKYLTNILTLISNSSEYEINILGGLPLGLSFFCFSAISYVVDIYRGRLTEKRNLFRTALYLTLFFKVVSGPVLEYNKFETQIEKRESSFSMFSDGMWRFVIGLGKKVLLAGSLGNLAAYSFEADYTTLPAMLAWLGSFAYMLQIYYDFSGYSDMAIGLGKIFGFELPENFIYPYASTSVTEYWQRWHKTLGEWFRDYLYYPLTLGPAIKLRKTVQEKYGKAVAKFCVNVFTLGVIWLCTGLWHGQSINYVIWGIINGGFSLMELYKKPLKNEKLDKALGWLYTFLVAFFVKTLTNIIGLNNALLYFGAMFGLNGNPANDPIITILLHDYWVWLLIGTIAAFPIHKALYEKIASKNNALAIASNVIRVIFVIVIFILSIAYTLKFGSTAFIYQGY